MFRRGVAAAGSCRSPRDHCVGMRGKWGGDSFDAERTIVNDLKPTDVFRCLWPSFTPRRVFEQTRKGSETTMNPLKRSG
ncbi:hypothetical protein V7x_23280 [Crateriforma conspicua]|uniref:Uncharacterized protein n=1 Tax=Crateriforma conspicua TaxID=2527996 RepID=A0A5C6FUU8_9PLAN|nr:hypothetical protein V7x_23280 [Crateriforma conspicua]